MSHAITQIRSAVTAAVTGLATSGARVYETREYPLSDQHIPGLIVFTLTDKLNEQGDQRRRIQERELSVVVEAAAKKPAGSSLDQALEQMVLEVQRAIAADRTLGGLVKMITCASVQFAVGDDIEKPVGKAGMTWTCRYLVAEDDPETIIRAVA